MKKSLWFYGLLAAIIVASCGLQSSGPPDGAQSEGSKNMKKTDLPEPRLKSSFSVEESLSARRSVRAFTEQPVSLPDLSQLLWAAQGITEQRRGFRTAPSAGATFPMEVYLFAANIQGVEKGFYHYRIGAHQLEMIRPGDMIDELLRSALMQSWLRQAAGIFILCADYERTTERYGERGIRYVHIESGHIGQNIALQAVALELGTTMVGAFRDDQLAEVLQLPADLAPLYIIPFGHPR